MRHLDAKAIRERLNTVVFALSALEDCPHHPEHRRIAATARSALRDIALLVTDDELEENGAVPSANAQRLRNHIRDETIESAGTTELDGGVQIISQCHKA